jgi:glycosyltransferase involved in cell wall biosynthesis
MILSNCRRPFREPGARILTPVTDRKDATAQRLRHGEPECALPRRSVVHSQFARAEMTAAQILHIDLSAPGPAPVAQAEKSLTVFWWADYPVGQAWDTGAIGRTLDIARLQREGVAPDVLASAKATVEGQSSPSSLAGPGATVIICTRDRPEALRLCLASLPLQTRAPERVIVVDNGSRDDRTKQVTLAAGAEYVREERPGLDIARNTGAARATTEIIAYTDDDVRLHPRWLERLIRAFDDPQILAVTGLVLPAELETDAQLHFETHWGFGRGYRRIDFGPAFYAAGRKLGCPAWEIGAGANMAIRREAFARIGHFDERLDVGAAGCSGDSEYWHRILSRGWMCRYEPSAVAFHVHRRDLVGLSSQIFHYMRGHSAALMVQYERSGGIGNLRRAFVSLPLWYARRIGRKLLKGSSQRDQFLMREIAGYLSGLLYYFRKPRSDAG